MPSKPNIVYKGAGWVSWMDWLGVGRGRWRSFEEARRFARGLGLKSFAEWREYCKSGEKPYDIPAYPNEVYAVPSGEWRSWGDWLGTGNVPGGAGRSSG
jgi:hypothetical protein